MFDSLPTSPQAFVPQLGRVLAGKQPSCAHICGWCIHGLCLLQVPFSKVWQTRAHYWSIINLEASVAFRSEQTRLFKSIHRKTVTLRGHVCLTVAIIVNVLRQRCEHNAFFDAWGDPCLQCTGSWWSFLNEPLCNRNHLQQDLLGKSCAPHEKICRIRHFKSLHFRNSYLHANGLWIVHNHNSWSPNEHPFNARALPQTNTCIYG